MESDERREEVIRRVRSVIKLAANKGGGQHDPPKERARKETEFFKRLFMQCDKNGSGTLNQVDVITMARKHLKIAERLIPDEQLMEFFSAIDVDGGGEIDFTEFLTFLRTPDDPSHMNEIILNQVKRAVRLASWRQNMTLQKLEYRFYNSAAEGIIDTVNSDGALRPEEMRRFFRKVLDIQAHDTPDKNLVVAFNAMDEDGGGTLDADEFMNFIRDAMCEETTLCPKFVRDPEIRRLPDVLANMRGALPERFPKHRPGTTHSSGPAGLPFCLTGRDMESGLRNSLSTPALLQEPRWRPMRSEAATVSSLLPSGLPKTPSSVSPASPYLARTGSATFLTTTATFDAPVSPQKQTVSCPISPKTNGEEGAVRGAYTGKTGSLGPRDAKTLNRIEERLGQAGVDVRGRFNKRSSA